MSYEKVNKDADVEELELGFSTIKLTFVSIYDVAEDISGLDVLSF